MTKEERLALARERVKRWKKDHPKSIRDQWARRYQRKKGAETEARKAEVGERQQPKLSSLGELSYEPIALSDGDRETVYRNAVEYSRRSGRPIPEGLKEPENGGGRVAPLMEPKQKGGQVETLEEKRVEAALAKFVAKRAERGGVAVPPLEL